MILYDFVLKNYKCKNKCKHFLGNFIMFLVIGQSNSPLQKKKNPLQKNLKGGGLGAVSRPSHVV
jgi:hypothetical protein